MSLLFVTCAVIGVTTLASQTTLSLLGFDGGLDVFEDEVDATRGFVDGVVPEDKSSDAATLVNSPAKSRDQDGKGSRVGMIRLRAVGLSILFFGLMGSAAEASHFTLFNTFAAASLVAAVTYVGGVFLLRQTAIVPFVAGNSDTETIAPELIQDESDELSEASRWS